MTSYGKTNLLGMLLLPVAAAVAALMVLGTDKPALITVFVLNLVPTLIPAALGSVWYLFRAVVPSAVAPGAEYIAAPQYLLMGVILLSVVAWPGCLIARRV